MWLTWVGGDGDFHGRTGLELNLLRLAPSLTRSIESESGEPFTVCWEFVEWEFVAAVICELCECEEWELPFWDNEFWEFDSVGDGSGDDCFVIVAHAGVRFVSEEDDDDDEAIICKPPANWLASIITSEYSIRLINKIIISNYKWMNSYSYLKT